MNLGLSALTAISPVKYRTSGEKVSKLMSEFKVPQCHQIRSFSALHPPDHPVISIKQRRQRWRSLQSTIPSNAADSALPASYKICDLGLALSRLLLEELSDVFWYGRVHFVVASAIAKSTTIYGILCHIRVTIIVRAASRRLSNTALFRNEGKRPLFIVPQFRNLIRVLHVLRLLRWVRPSCRCFRFTL